MNVHRYRLSFNTPAFLGNASQQTQRRCVPVAQRSHIRIGTIELLEGEFCSAMETVEVA